MIHKPQCHYIDPEDNRCTGKARANGLCYWHDPTIVKHGADKKKIGKVSPKW